MELNKISLLLLLLMLSVSAFSQDYYYPPQSRPNINYDNRGYVPGRNNINRDNPALNRQHSPTKEIQRQFDREMEYQDQRQMYNLMNGRRIDD